jgi:hypothetical protein
MTTYKNNSHLRHVFESGERSELHPSARPQVGQVDASSGLVHSSTSPPPFEIDPRTARLRRMKHGTITAARLHDQETQKGGFRFKAAMLTLTYRDDQDWKPDHISQLMKVIGKWLFRRGIKCRYVSVMELTKRGRPHYHVVFWLPKGVTLPKPDKQGWWPHGMTRIEWARNPVGYVAKYASKGLSESTRFPKGARIHATGGLSKDSRIERAWWLAPVWVRERWSLAEKMYPRPAPGGGWFALSGEWEQSPWDVIYYSGHIYLKKRVPP